MLIYRHERNGNKKAFFLDLESLWVSQGNEDFILKTTNCINGADEMMNFWMGFGILLFMAFLTISVSAFITDVKKKLREKKDVDLF